MTTREIPVCDTSNPADLEAWFGSFGMYDHLRKARLAMCAEMIRAGAAAGDSKLSEARVNDLAHTHPAYLDFLFTNLNGRRIREQNVIDSQTQGMHR